MQSQIVCSGCRSILLYPRGASNVCCALCNAVTPVPPPGMNCVSRFWLFCNCVWLKIWNWFSFCKFRANWRCCCCWLLVLKLMCCLTISWNKSILVHLLEGERMLKEITCFTSTRNEHRFEWINVYYLWVILICCIHKFLFVLEI